ncbi:MAG: GDP-mannose 4,6-dehydratase [Pseudomonadota bacterium]
MKTALICGVSGQDGSLLARLLLENGYRVVGGSRDAQSANFANLERLGIRDDVVQQSVTLTDFRSVIHALIRFRPDEIYNLAGQTSVSLSFDQPVETLESISVATLNLLEAVRVTELTARIYNASSSECFGDTGTTAATEATHFRPRSPYGVAKAAAHWQVANYREAYGLHCCSGILFNHESPLRPARFVTRKVIAAAVRIARGSRETVELGNLDVIRDWGWAPEYVEAMWLMLQQPQPSDFVICTGQSIALREFVRLCFAGVGLDWQQHVRVRKDLYRTSDITQSYGNADKAQRELGWSAHTRVADVVRRMLEAEQGASLDQVLRRDA